MLKLGKYCAFWVNFLDHIAPWSMMQPHVKTSKFNGVGECWLLFPQFARCDSQTPSQATASQLLQKNCQKKTLSYFPRTVGKVMK